MIFLRFSDFLSPFTYTFFTLYLPHLSINIVLIFGFGFLSFNSYQLFIHSFEGKIKYSGETSAVFTNP